ncbi:DNA polymerase II [Hahella sp. CCB-MM4]|uniref:DNA polymerase II n=1 Tax=Hahella sp. (strain CCB-MM4) TaxID=1926491 RepID=UPI000B9B4938|nr:DNA polymerase II [Hahella sp. CCB-MM4]OZG72831.1 DNA polymerase II [Hahella sp. CCB-MM4]
MSHAFLLTRQWDDAPANGRGSKKLQLTLWATGPDGPIRLHYPAQQAVCFLDTEEVEQARSLLSRDYGPSHAPDPVWHDKPVNLLSFKGKPVHAFYFKEQRVLYRARDLLQNTGLTPLEADIQPHDRFLMERFITASFEYKGAPARHGNFSELVDAPLKPAHYRPDFTVLSLDIETSMTGDHLYSIGLVMTRSLAPGDPEKDHRRSENEQVIEKVFMVGSPDHINASENQHPIPEYLELCLDERDLMHRFLQWFAEEDPDIIIGWSVINFDLRFLQKKADSLGIPLNLGRGNSPLDWRQSRNDEGHYTLCMPGRLVLDGIETLKSATYVFESFSLQSVANTLLNRGKLIHDVDNRGEEITRLFREDKISLAAYNLEDCQLVWDIFRHTELIAFAVERAELTGLAMDRFGGSVAAFDHRYLPRLHRAGYVAPSLVKDPIGVGSPGGYVMDSIPGLYEHVLVLDFKSLYPSIIRTFKIDPLARIKGILEEPTPAYDRDDQWDQRETPEVPKSDFVPGFNGAVFSKDSPILPDLIGELWQARDQAKRHKNAAMSQAIKILMNSFYGVLGTPGCRFFDYRLPSSITLRGHRILNRTKALIEAEGHEVIYGDTDSVFVHLRQVKDLDNQQIFAIGEQLAKHLNQWWQKELTNQYQIQSYLEIEFETHFTRFVMPTIRGSEKGSKKRYAGLVVKPDGKEDLVFKGLETVRTDWTPLAREFQKELYRRIFYYEPYESYIQGIVQSIRNGERDEQLYYRKRLRRKIDEYQRNIPPHVQAARRANLHRKELHQPPLYRRGDWVEYVMTLNGPEALSYRQSSLDYDLYIDRQIAPIVDGICHFLGTSFEEIASPQIGLF